MKCNRTFSWTLLPNTFTAYERSSDFNLGHVIGCAEYVRGILQYSQVTAGIIASNLDTIRFFHVISNSLFTSTSTPYAIWSVENVVMKLVCAEEIFKRSRISRIRINCLHLLQIYCLFGSRDRVISILCLGFGLGDVGSGSQQGQNFLSPLKHTEGNFGSSSFFFGGKGGMFPWCKETGRGWPFSTI